MPEQLAAAGPDIEQRPQRKHLRGAELDQAVDQPAVARGQLGSRLGHPDVCHHGRVGRHSHAVAGGRVAAGHHVGAAGGQRRQDGLLQVIHIGLRVQLADLDQQHPGQLGGGAGALDRGRGQQAQQAHRPPGQLPVLGPVEHLGHGPAVVRDHVVGEPVGLGPLVQPVPEVVPDPVRRDQVPITLLGPRPTRGRCPRDTAAELAADEVDYAPLLREEETQPLQQIQGLRVDRVATAEPLGRHCPPGKRGLQFPVRPVEPLLGARPQPNQPAGHHILDVPHGEREAGLVAVPDAGQLALADVRHLLDAFLQGGQHDHRPLPRPLAEELQEPEILGQRRSLLGPQELGQLVQQQDQRGPAPVGRRRQHRVPAGQPVHAGRRRRPVEGGPGPGGDDVLQHRVGAVLNQRDRHHQVRPAAGGQPAQPRVPAGQRGPGGGPREQFPDRGQEMRLAGAERAHHEEARAGGPGGRLQDRGQAAADVAGDHQLAQPATAPVQPDDGVHRRDVQQVADPRCPAGGGRLRPGHRSGSGAGSLGSSP